MTRMSREAFDRACAYLRTQARPLEQALYRHHFEQGPVQDVCQALAAFQNADGGFGKALEPDYRAEGSSVLGTLQALGRMAEVGLSEGHPMVQQAIRFLLQAYDVRTQGWEVLPPGGDHEPHAPWWNHDALATTFHGFRLNPFAEVLGRLWAMGGQEGRARVRDVLPLLFVRLDAVGHLEPSECECLGVLWRSLVDDAGTRSRLESFLKDCLPREVERDPRRWASYGLKPLWAFPHPESPGAEACRELIEQAIAFELSTQASDGAWEPFWHWDEAFPEHWATACREWRGWLTLRNLVTLQAYDRLPGALAGEARVMNDTEAQAFLEAYFHRLFGMRDLTALEAYLHPDYQDDDVGDPSVSAIEDSRQFLMDLFQRHPGIRVDVERVVSLHEVLAAYLHWICDDEGSSRTLRRGVALFVMKEGRIFRRHTFLYQDGA